MTGGSIRYRDAGVDIDRATAAKLRIGALARTTFNAGVLSEIGSFGGLFRPDLTGFQEPVLVASTDGVGTKIKIAISTGRYDTVGEDLVNHSVNDILVQGGVPLFFLDYFASAGLPPETVASVVSGVARGCLANGAALLGGETAEMPGFYQPGDFDLAGTIVGIVDRKNVLDGSRIQPGDHILALAANGLHTNGYSLARKVLLEVGGYALDSTPEGLDSTVADALLRVHPSYLHPLRVPLERSLIAGLAHITGGGITENLPRILPSGVEARIRIGSWQVLPIFELIQRLGKIDREEMYRTFNMGAGMLVVCSDRNAAELRSLLPGAVPVGSIVKGNGRVVYEA